MHPSNPNAATSKSSSAKGSISMTNECEEAPENVKSNTLSPLPVHMHRSQKSQSLTPEYWITNTDEAVLKAKHHVFASQSSIGGRPFGISFSDSQFTASEFESLNKNNKQKHKFLMIESSNNNNNNVIPNYMQIEASTSKSATSATSATTSTDFDNISEYALRANIPWIYNKNVSKMNIERYLLSPFLHNSNIKSIFHFKHISSFIIANITCLIGYFIIWLIDFGLTNHCYINQSENINTNANQITLRFVVLFFF